MIPYGRQHISDADISEVVRVLKSDFLTQGPEVPRFERGVADYCGAKYGLAFNSATSALHLACLALGLGEGDHLWTSPISFVASSNCGLYCGAKVDFVDIDPRTYNLSVTSLEKKLAEAEAVGKLPKVVVAVHFAGQACDMQAIQRLARRYRFSVIEDASHAIGGRYLGESIGNCRYSDITIFSFHPVKIITSAEGGMALTNQKELAREMSLLRTHGITRDPGEMTHESEGPWYYQQVGLGYNYRMTELQAALGLSQLNRLDSYVERRHEVAQFYDRQLESLPVTRPWQHQDTFSSFHLYPIRVEMRRTGRARGEVFKSLRDQGVGVNVHYIPIHTQPFYQGLGFRAGDFPEAELYYSEAISLPIYPTMSTAQKEQVVKSLRLAMGA